MPRRPQKPGSAVLTDIHAKRQVRRPHYLGKLMARHDKDRADLIRDLGVDKGQLSRWLDDEKPQTPGPRWARELGNYFAITDDPDDFVDIFTDPDLQRFQRITRGLSDQELDRMLTSLEAGYRAKGSR